jgi:hypothetical protein
MHDEPGELKEFRERTLFDRVIGGTRMLIMISKPSYDELSQSDPPEKPAATLEYYVNVCGQMARVSSNEFRMLLDSHQATDLGTIARALSENLQTALDRIVEELDATSSASFASQLLEARR